VGSRECALTVYERSKVRWRYAEPVAGRGGIPIDERGADAERVLQLQPHPRRRVEGGADITLERLEAARRPELRLAVLGAERHLRAHREDLRGHAEQAARVVGDVGAHFVELFRPRQNVDL